MKTSRVLLGGFAHEVRNIASAAGALADRVDERCGLCQDEEYAALKRTLCSLSDLAASGLRAGLTENRAIIDLSATLEQARIVIQPLLDGGDIDLIWNVPDRLPRVQADHLLVIQVFLNLARNTAAATRALHRSEFRVDASSCPDGAMILVCDNGPGILHPGNLFQPFRSDGGGSGLGLYVSRVVLRSYGGDLWHEPGTAGACFCIQLKAAPMD
jgi:signal transduction histidine kinase